MIFSNNVRYYLSGGPANTSSSLSLGGAPSNAEMTNSLNNIFSTVQKQEMSQGAQVFRCLYIANHNISTLTNASIWLDEENPVSSLSIGIYQSIEIQQLTISGTPTGGSFTLTYIANVNGIQVSQQTNPISFSSTLATMSNYIQVALNSLSLLGQVTVTGQSVDGQLVYSITFGGIHAYRYHQLLQINNNLTGTGVVATLAIQVTGSPVNTIVSNVGFENQPPNGVSFSQPTQLSPISIGNLNSSDIFGIWLCRTTPIGTTATGNTLDEINININGSINI